MPAAVFTPAIRSGMLTGVGLDEDDAGPGRDAWAHSTSRASSWAQPTFGPWAAPRFPFHRRSSSSAGRADCSWSRRSASSVCDIRVVVGVDDGDRLPRAVRRLTPNVSPPRPYAVAICAGVRPEAAGDSGRRGTLQADGKSWSEAGSWWILRSWPFCQGAVGSGPPSFPGLYVTAGSVAGHESRTGRIALLRQSKTSRLERQDDPPQGGPGGA